MTATLQHVQSLQADVGVAVTITRGTGDSAQTCNLVAVPAASSDELYGKDGSFTEVVLADWLILVSQWTLTGPANPQKGDLISLPNSGPVYVVSHPNSQKPPFRNFNQLDRSAIAWRVHSVPR